jgi:hypothetical protein
MHRANPRIGVYNRLMSSAEAFERRRQIHSLFVRNCVIRARKGLVGSNREQVFGERLHLEAPDATTEPSAPPNIKSTRGRDRAEIGRIRRQAVKVDRFRVGDHAPGIRTRMLSSAGWLECLSATHGCAALGETYECRIIELELPRCLDCVYLAALTRSIPNTISAAASRPSLRRLRRNFGRVRSALPSRAHGCTIPGRPDAPTRAKTRQRR